MNVKSTTGKTAHAPRLALAAFVFAPVLTLCFAFVPRPAPAAAVETRIDRVKAADIARLPA